MSVITSNEFSAFWILTFCTARHLNISESDVVFFYHIMVNKDE